MPIIYDDLKKLYPYPVYRKKRKEQALDVVMNDKLEISYLNDTSVRFLDLCSGKKTISEIYGLMLEEYDVDPETLRNDIINLLRDLQWKKIIRLSRTPTE